MKLGRSAGQARAWGSGLERQRNALADSGVHVDYVHVDGLRIRYALRPGQGTPLLFCNGIGANLELALSFVRELPQRPVLLFDLPGLGGSPQAWLWPSFRRYARLAVGVADALQMPQFAVAGVSWGGALAQRITYDHPQRVERLILLATSFGALMVPGKPSALLRMVTPQRYRSRTHMAANAGALYGGAMRHDANLAIEFAGLTRAPARRAYLQQLCAASSFLSLPWLHRIRCPVLVMAGDDDPIVRPVNARILSALLPDARLELVADGGHLFVSTHAAEVARRIEHFLQPKA